MRTSPPRPAEAMARIEPGERIIYTVTYLEMTAPPAQPLPPQPAGPLLALIGAHRPPVAYFLYLYRAVGAEFEWTDWLMRPREELAAWLGDERVDLYTLLVDGWPGGFFVLDGREAGVCDLAYFGLVPEARGRGLARWFLANAVKMGWERSGVERLTVNTNTLDHPRAIALYQWAGFVPVAREEHERVLTRLRES